MKIDGCASLVCLREHAPQNLKLVAANDADPVAEVVKIISNEVVKKSFRNIILVLEIMSRNISLVRTLLLRLVSGLVSTGKVTRKSLSFSINTNHNEQNIQPNNTWTSWQASSSFWIPRTG